VDDELRLLVAASAATLGLGWPDFDWEPLSEVLLYPDDFARDYGRAAGDDDDRAGEAHPWGTVILSLPALIESWDEPGDAFHVGYHELAHLLAVEQTVFDGIPVGLDSEAQRRWVEVRDREMQRLRRGRSVLDPYGADDPVEFLPVAVEAFFDCPVELRRRHRELYEELAAWLRQDPAAWEEARG
jgi:Mlc titration factor MtfA (ptsG expression regulator)